MRNSAKIVRKVLLSSAFLIELKSFTLTLFLIFSLLRRVLLHTFYWLPLLWRLLNLAHGC